MSLILKAARRIVLCPAFFIAIALFTVCAGGQIVLINPTTQNGSFENNTSKTTFLSGLVPNWTVWTNVSTADNDSGVQADAVNASQGTYIAYLQGGNADYNLTTYIITAGDVYTYSWDWVETGRGNATAQLGYWNGANVVAIAGTTTSNPNTTAKHLGLGISWTVPPGDPSIGHPIAMTVLAPVGANYPEVDNFILTVVPFGSTVAGPTVISPTNQLYPGPTVTLSAAIGGTAPTGYSWQSDGGTSGVTWTNLLPASTTNTYAINTTGMAPGVTQYRLVVTAVSGMVTNTPAALTIFAPTNPLLVSDTTISPATTEAGNVVTMNATFSGAPPLAYQWQFSDNATFTNNILGATNSSYIISDAAVGNTGSYRLICTNNLGKANSSFAALSVTALTDVEILTFTNNFTPVPSGFDIAQLSTTGNQKFPAGLNYYDDNALNGVPGQTFTTGTNASGYLLSSLYILWGNIEGAHAAANPYTLCIYSAAGTNCTLLTTYTNQNVAPAMAFGTWTKWIGLSNVLAPNAVYAYSISARSTSDAGAGYMQIGNVTGNPYPGGSVALFDSTVVNGGVAYGSDTNEDATFLLHLSSAPFSAPVIQSVTMSPVNSAANPVFLGTPVTLTAVVVGSTPQTNQWLTDNGTGGATFTNISGATSNPYVLNTSSLSPTTQYQYEVAITNVNGSAVSVPVTLYLTNASGPIPVSGPTYSPSAVVVVGSNVTVTAAFTGSQPIIYQWQHAGTNLSGATGNSLTITAAQFANAGAYSLVASNNPPGVGPTTARITALLYVIPPGQNNTGNAGIADGGTSPTPGTYDVYQTTDGDVTPPAPFNYYVDNASPPGQMFTTGSTLSSPMLDYVYVKEDVGGNTSGLTTPQPFAFRVYKMLDATNAQLLTTYVTTNAYSSISGDWVVIFGLTNVLQSSTRYAYSFARNVSGYWRLSCNVGLAPFPDGQAVLVPVPGGAVTLSSPDVNGLYYDAAYIAGLTQSSVVVKSSPHITGVYLSGTTLNLNATDGTANGQFIILSSTNVTLPFSKWTPVLTNAFDANGNLTLSTNIINPAVPRQFFIILQ